MKKPDPKSPHAKAEFLTPFNQMLQTSTKLDPHAQVSALTQPANFQGSLGRDLLRQLQQKHGNNYVQRLLALNRNTAGKVDPDPNKQILAREMEEEEGESADLLRKVARLDINQSGDTLEQSTGVTQKTSQPGVIQAQFELGSPGDVYEQEADRVAEQVARNSSVSQSQVDEQDLGHPSSDSTLGRDIVSALSRLSENHPPTVSHLEQKENGVLRIARLNRNDAQTTISTPLAARIQQSKGAGNPLSPALQHTMSAQLGHDFSQVRVKNDEEAADLSQELGARAFTNGADVWLGRGESVNDSKLMAHELTHVVQQGAAPKLTPQRSAALDRSTLAREALSHLGLAVNSDSSLYHQKIQRFLKENDTSRISSLRRQILESPAVGDIRQKETNPGKLATCAGSSGINFPSRSTWVKDENVKKARAEDWTAGEGDYFERAGWIVWNKDTKKFSVVNRAKGDENGVNPGSPPPDKDPEYCVGHYHTHPPLSPAMEKDQKDGKIKYPVAPSQADKDFANGLQNPGIVQDFTDTKRTKTTDYTYGPSKRPSDQTY